MIPRPEYPRPQFRRTRWTNLNGEWAFAFDDHDEGLRQGWQLTSGDQMSSGSHPFVRRIIVPFCHQATASSIGDTSSHDVVWYARVFDPAPFDPTVECQLLHFGAVDYSATVWVNGSQVAHHQGGHTPFSADITHALGARENLVIVRVHDPCGDATLPRGKQAWTEEPSDIFYTRTTGIWQTVWLEPVSRCRIDAVRTTPDLEGRSVEVEVAIEDFNTGVAVVLTVDHDGERVARRRVEPQSAVLVWQLSLAGQDGLREPAPWSPEHPTLYDLRLELLDGDETIDAVDSYFGVRQIEARGGKVYLNGRLLYQRLVLDQGYFPGGILTAPTDDDLRRDIELAKSMGFNGARKHQKVEDPRWLYWADTLGFLVWAEMANAYEYSLDYVRRITDEWQMAVRRDYNHPCIIVWVPMNESWGGRRTPTSPLEVDHLQTLYHLTRSIDGTRLVVSNDGWEHVGDDLCTIHDYSPPDALAVTFRTLESSLAASPGSKDVHYSRFPYTGAPVIVSEFGGIALRDDDETTWGYTVTSDSAELLSIYEAMVAALTSSPVVQGFCYTQLTDVGLEVNGLLTQERRPKAPLDEIRRITTRG